MQLPRWWLRLIGTDVAARGGIEIALVAAMSATPMC